MVRAMLNIARKKYLSALVSFIFMAQFLAPCGGAFAKDTDIKRTIAVLAFNPAVTSGDRDALNSARGRVSKSKKFFIVPKRDVAAFSEKYYNQGDSGVRKALDEAADLLARGKEQYDRLQFSESVETLKLCIKKYRDSFEYVRDATNVMRALIYLGMAHITMNDREGGKRYITESLRMDPERRTRKLSESLFPPNIRAIYKARQDYISKQQGGKLSIIVTPPGGTLYVNGFKVSGSVSQIVIDDLPLGKHYVMIEKVGYERFYNEVKLGKEDETLNVVMEGWSGFSEVDVGSINEVRRERLKSISADLGADVLLLGSVSALDEERFVAKGQLFDSKDGSFSRVEQESFSKIEKAPKAFANVVGSLFKKSLTNYNEVISYSYEGMAPITVTKDRFDDEPYRERKTGGDSIFSKWWFWTIVGGAALAAGGSVLLFTDVMKKDPNHNLVKVSR